MVIYFNGIRLCICFIPFQSKTLYAMFVFDVLKTRGFYLTSFTQAWLAWPFLAWQFGELFSTYVLLWNQYKYIPFNIFSCRFLIISYKMLIIKGISYEKKCINHIWNIHFRCRKNWKPVGVQNYTFWVATWL